MPFFSERIFFENGIYFKINTAKKEPADTLYPIASLRRHRSTQKYTAKPRRV